MGIAQGALHPPCLPRNSQFHVTEPLVDRACKSSYRNILVKGEKDNRICGSLLLASGSSASAVTHGMQQCKMNNAWTMARQVSETLFSFGLFDTSIVIEAFSRLLSKPASIHVLP